MFSRKYIERMIAKPLGGDNKDDNKGDNKRDRLLYCSFCGKSQHVVTKLIAGPSVFICDECVELCNGIIREEGGPLSCSFCKKSQHEVRFLISGPEASYICEGCAELCNEIIQNKLERRKNKTAEILEFGC